MLHRPTRAGTFREAILPVGALIVSAAVPILTWLVWMKIHFGDFTGSTAKAQLLGWTPKQFANWWPHPIFTVSGMCTFLSELFASFWRGEVMWHARIIGFKGPDLFYVLSSLGLILIAVISLARGHDNVTGEAQRRVLWMAAASVFATILFFAFLSLQFDFGACINPSRERPYFFQGRLMLGALIPFAIIYVYGLSRLLGNKPHRVLGAVGAIATGITLSGVLANSVAFTSAYNWFHM